MAFRNRVRNPRLQARIFLPRWFVKVVRPGKDIPDDTVQLHVPLDMSKIDIKNYMEKIYSVPVAKVHTRIQSGKVKQFVYGNDVVIKKTPDIKIAYVMLREGTFKFPDMFPDLSPVESEDHEGDELKETSEQNAAIPMARWFNT
ncbi:39S ribosomal protein L23, mitochondrial-like [Hydractinia symbiolongicarpus]|uniref:39S ribosomal protein L23, mitochondrial-like n=1 Tax=Hydractinia symbiolongicarpus TaxID=13093 RepID=UPI0025501821|nr:39S ribosomal protein L23, mitochondrial-like [Hydractinia symbiolongicarpus]